MIKERLNQVIAKINAREPRERLIILGAGLALVYIMFSVLFLDPIAATKQENIDTLASLSQQLENFNKETELVVLKINKLKASDKSGELSSLEAQANQLSQNVIGITGKTETISVLSGLLLEDKTLTLIRLDTSGLIPLEEETGSFNLLKTKTNLYKREITIEFTGDFFGTLNYLQRLKEQKWQLFWDKVIYTVTEYPKANVILTIYAITEKTDDDEEEAP